MASGKNSRAVIVGIFVFVGLLILTILILTLGGQRKTFQKSITIKAVFDDIAGLQKGNNVWFSGVKIGTVKSISFYGASQVKVEMNIDEASKEFIRKNAKARISSEGLIGNRIVVIYPGASQSEPIAEGDMLGVEKATNPDEIMSTFQANNQNLLAITNNIKIISQQILEGRGTAGKLLADTTIFYQVQATMNMLRSSAANAQRLSNDLAAYTAKLNNKGTLANDLVSDTTIISNLKTAVSRMNQATVNANQVLNTLSNTANTVSNGLKNPNTPAGLLLNDEKSGTEMKNTLQTLRSASIKLDEDLEAVQHNFLLKGFFKKRKAAEEKAKQLP